MDDMVPRSARRSSDDDEELMKTGEFRGRVIAELQILQEGQHRVVQAVEEFKERVGARLGDAESRIQEIKGEMNIVLTIGKWIFAPVFGAVGLGIITIIAWYAMRK